MGHFSPETIRNIKDEIMYGTPYKEIQSKYGIKNEGLLRRINSGKYFFSDVDVYPLFSKGSTKKRNEGWVSTIQFQLRYCENMTIAEIARENEKSETTVRKINNGWAHRKNNLIYPLR